MQCKTCKKPIPQQRLQALPNTRTCVSCSDEEAKGCVDIVYHKTGNTIQIMDKESAAAINKAARRSGFGSLRSMKGGSGNASLKVELGTKSTPPRMPTQADFEKVGTEMMQMLDWREREGILKFLQRQVDNRTISGRHQRQLIAILDQFKPAPKKEQARKIEVKVDEEIEWAFRNWKNSKTFR